MSPHLIQSNMACTFISKGRKEPCKDIVGGIKAVYFIDEDLTIAYEGSTDVIDTIGTGISAYRYEVKGGSSFEQTITSSRETGTTFYEQALTLQFKKLDKDTHEQLALLAVSLPHVLIEDYNEQVFLMGTQYGADVNGGTIVTGTAMGDLSGYTLTLAAQEKKPANFIAKTAATEDATTTITGAGVTIETDNIDP